MEKRAAWIILSSNSILGLRCLPVKMKLIQTCQLAAGDLGTSCFLMAMACRAVPVTDTGWDRSYIILIALGQLEGEGREKIKSNTEKEHKQKLPKCLLLDRDQKWHFLGVCSGSCCQLFINTLDAAEELSLLWSRVSLCEYDWSPLQIRAERRRDTLCPSGHAFAILHVAQ